MKIFPINDNSRPMFCLNLEYNNDKRILNIRGGLWMNKYLLTGLLALVLLLSGCILERGDNSTNNNNSNKNQEEQKGNQEGKDNENEQKESEIETITIEEYYPIEENVRYVYEGKGNEYASYDVYIDYVTEHKVQQRINNGGTSLARIMEIKDGKLINTYSRGETYYRENLLKTENGEEEVLLMEPLKEGTTWKLNDSSVRTITNLSADISTPSGNYKAIEVSTEGPHGKTLEYYAKGIGLVKTLFNSEGIGGQFFFKSNRKKRSVRSNDPILLS